MASDDWKRLASYVVARRIELGFRDRHTFSAATGITPRTLGKLETARQVSAPTLAAVELGLRWEPDSARRVLAGGDPEPVREMPAKTSAVLPAMTDDERRAVLAYLEVRRASDRTA